MPKIPMDTPQTSLNVPGLNAPLTREYGKIGEATERLGADIEQPSVDIFQQVKALQATNDANNAYYADKIDSDKKMQDLKLNSPDGLSRDSSGVIRMDPTTKQPLTIMDDYHTWADNRYQQNQDNLSPLASQLYRQRALPNFSDQTGLLMNDVQIMRVKSFDQNQSDNIQNVGDRLNSKPSLGDLYGSANDFTDDIMRQKGVLYNGEVADSKVQAVHQQLSMNYMQGRVTQILGMKKLSGDGPGQLDATYQTISDLAGAPVDADGQVVDGINNKNPIVANPSPETQARHANGLVLPQLGDMMKPEQKAAELDKLIKMIPMARASDIADLKTAKANDTAALMHGGPVNQDSIDKNNVAFVKAIQSGDIHVGEGTDILANGFVAQAIHDNYSDNAFHLQPIQNKMTLINQGMSKIQTEAAAFAKQNGIEAEAGNIGAEFTSKAQEKLEQYAKDDETIKSKDFANYVQTYTPQGQKAASILPWSNPIKLGAGNNPAIMQDYISTQKKVIGIGSGAQNPYDNRLGPTKDQSDQTANYLKGTDSSGNSVSAEAGGYAIASLKKAYGRDFPVIMDQMIDRDKNLSAGWNLPGLYNSQNTNARTAMVGALQGGKGIDDGFKTAIASTNGTVKESDMDTAVSGLTRDYVASKVQASPNNRDTTKYTNDINTAVGRYAKELYLKDPSRSMSDVANEAYQTFVGGFVAPTTIGSSKWSPSGSNRSTTLMLPSQIALPSGENKVIGQPDQANVQKNFSQAISEDGIKSLNPSVPTTASGGVSPQADEFNSMVARTARGVYVNTAEGPGVQIWYQAQKKNSNGTTTPSDQLLFTKNANGHDVPSFIPIEKLLKTPPPQEGVIGGAVHSISKFLGISQ